MCGIIGYVGSRPAVSVLLEGLKRLEYRGYDSAGIAVVSPEGELIVRRAQGKLRNLEEALKEETIAGTYGIGHTRWATHGRPTEENAHPHRGARDEVVVVHNGIIENYLELRRELEACGHQFRSETDTEVIAHLIEAYYEGNLEQAVLKTVRRLRGMFALGVISRLEPQKVIAVRFGPPAVVGLGQNEYFLASDVPPLLSYTRDVIFLEDGDVAVLTPDGVALMNFQGTPVKRPVQHVPWDPIMAEKGGFRHFMLKEIYEQPRAVRDTLVGRVGPESGKVFLGELDWKEEELASFEEIKMVACGTSWHAALAGKFMIEQLARIPVEVDYGSEFRYRDPILRETTLTVLISQSGETADTLAAQKEVKSKGGRDLAICNVAGSSLTRAADGTILTHAGPEIGVASTKAFTAQLTALMLLALRLAQARRMLTREESFYWVRELLSIPAKLEAVLARSEPIENLARHLFRARDFLYLGRGIHYPIALEGALKLKEISYIHAEGYPAGEMKHGPNALIDENFPVVVLATGDDSPASRQRYGKTLSNIQEVKARGGFVVAIACEGDTEVAQHADATIYIPRAPELLLPILEVVPLQLLAYHIAVRRGCDVDQPRNLAKSVTVE